MPLCCEPGFFRFIPLLLPSGARLVVKAIVLESAAFSVAKKYISFFLNIPKAIFQTWFQFQLKAMSLCFVIVLAAFKLSPWRKSCDPPVTDSPASEPEPQPEPEPQQSTSASSNTEPKCEDIVKNVKKLRNHAVMSITHFTGDDLFWDLPILREKSSRFNRALLEGDRRKIDASRKALEAHGVIEPKPKTKAEYDRLMQEAMTDIYDFPDPVPNPPESELSEEIEHCGRVEERAYVELKDVNSNSDVKLKNIDPVNTKGKAKKRVNFSLDNETSSNKTNSGCRHDLQLAMQNKLLRSRLNMTNCKLEDMLRSSNSILEEVMRLNEQFDKLTTVSSKITGLQHELGLGKQLLREVEEERNEMKLKLLALEKLIKEEEEYLDDVSCESGYEEVEHFCDSTDEM